jgi:hypothetical protein
MPPIALAHRSTSTLLAALITVGILPLSPTYAMGEQERNQRPAEQIHLEKPDPAFTVPTARPQQVQLRPGETWNIEGFDDLQLIGADPDKPARLVRSSTEPITGDPITGDEVPLYSNTGATLEFPPGANVLIADDLDSLAQGFCDVFAYEVRVTGGGDGTGDGFSVNLALYDDCPAAGGEIIPGSDTIIELPDDGVFTVRHDLPANNTLLPPKVWVGMRFSRAGAGILVGSQAEIGFTADVYHFPSVPCEARFGASLYAGFYARLLGSSECETFQPTQVNVNANGGNITGDAANEPSIAVDPNNPDRIAIGWRQFDTIANSFRQAGWGYSEDRGQTWTFPDVIEPGIFRSDPVLDFDADGNFYYNSLSTPNGAFLTDVFRSADQGQTWPAKSFAWGGDKQWMTIDRTDGPGRGHIYQAWSPFAGCCGNQIFNRSTDGGATFENPITIPNRPRWGTLSVGPDGELYVAGQDIFGSVTVARSTNAQDANATVTFDQATQVNLGGSSGGIGGGPNPGGLLGQIWVATDHSPGPRRGNVYVLSSVILGGNDPMDVMFARSQDGGATFGAPIRVNDDPPMAVSWQWFGTMSVAPNGRIDVVWLDTRNSQNEQLCELYHSSSSNGGDTWSTSQRLTPIFDSHVGWPQQNKMGDYFDMISHNDAAYLAYAATFNNEQDVYFMRIPADCNANGVVDTEDIAMGTSQDCNSNMTPDECEADTDCNENKVQDICDVATGESEDCNNNQVPDECEPATDCNNNQVQDICDLATGTSDDCNFNQVPDDCDISTGQESDCNGNLIPDSCDISASTSQDCNDNIIPDECDLDDCDGDPACDDCNKNGLLDECDLQGPCGEPFGLCPGQGNCCNPAGNGSPGCDCSNCCSAVCAVDSFCCNTMWDEICAEIAIGLAACPCGPDEILDCNDNGLLDECEPDLDCNLNGVQDICDLAFGSAEDCNTNDVPDECDLTAGTSEDCSWGPSTCCETRDEPGCSDPEVEACVCALDPSCCDLSWSEGCLLVIDLFGCADCQTLTGPNGIPDECDIAVGATADCNESSRPDNCEPSSDFNDDGSVDLQDYQLFNQCLTGQPGDPALEFCCFFDQDENGIVSLSDYAQLQNDF